MIPAVTLLFYVGLFFAYRMTPEDTHDATSIPDAEVDGLAAQPSPTSVSVGADAETEADLELDAALEPDLDASVDGTRAEDPEVQDGSSRDATTDGPAPSEGAQRSSGLPQGSSAMLPLPPPPRATTSAPTSATPPATTAPPPPPPPTRRIPHPPPPPPRKPPGPAHPPPRKPR